MNYHIELLQSLPTAQARPSGNGVANTQDNASPGHRKGENFSQILNHFEDYQIAPDIYQAVAQASQQVDVDFSYMMAQAAQESGFRADAKAPTSSATGLYQFIESTWIDMVARHGEKYGLADYSTKIRYQDNKLQIDDPQMRQEILDLRYDPHLNAFMAAEFARENAAHLESATGRTPRATDLYLAHFLGAGQASRFINALHDNPQQAAANLFPRAARANQAVFYHQGQPRSLEQVYTYFAQKIDVNAMDFSSTISSAFNSHHSRQIVQNTPAPTPVTSVADLFGGRNFLARTSVPYQQLIQELANANHAGSPAQASLWSFFLKAKLPLAQIHQSYMSVNGRY